MLEEKFPFIRDDLFLVAQVDDETGRLFFTMQKINEISGKVEFESKNEHNYPGISNMSWEQSQKMKANQNYEEIFCAMKNSIHEIAKLGWKSIEYDVQIEEFIILDPPIQHCLIFFLLSIDPSHISLQLDLIEKQSTFEGKANMPSIVANLEPVVKVLVSPHKGMDLSFSQDYLDGLLENYEIFRWYDREEYVIKNFETLLTRICELNPPIYTFEKFFIVIGLKALDDEIFRKSISQYLRKQTQISHFYAKITPNLEYLDILLGLSNVNRSFGGRYLKSKILEYIFQLFTEQKFPLNFDMIYRIGTEFRQVSVRLRSKISSFFDFYYDNISKEIKNVENLERFFCEFMFNDDIGLKHILENGKNPENFGYVKYHDYYVLQGLNRIFNRVLDDIPKNIQTSQKLSDELYGLLKNKNEKRE